MKKNILFLSAIVMLALVMTACQDPEYVLPTADRQGITSITALFTKGQYAEVEAAKLTVTDPDQTDFVIPIPWYYPEDSDNPTTEDDLKTMRVKVELDNNCTIDPPITILDLNQTHTFTFTNPQGEKRPITIRGERTRSNKCAVLAFTVNGDLSCIIDEENKTISIPTADDLTDATFECTLSPHATISPEPGTPMDMNEGATVTVTADNGTDKATYTLLKLVPANGVYAVEAEVLGTTYKGMCNIGMRPTVGGASRTIETHILDFDQDIYGLPLRIRFLRRIRDERKFPSLEALREQLTLDALNCKK